ncbi:MAG: putative membrane protein YiaA [Vicingaceae bacterium]|jgi:uncharacterized membrane protein YiaA
MLHCIAANWFENADLWLSEKGFLRMCFLMSVFDAVPVQKKEDIYI